jgi:hypothetical protein
MTVRSDSSPFITPLRARTILRSEPAPSNEQVRIDRGVGWDSHNADTMVPNVEGGPYHHVDKLNEANANIDQAGWVP